MSHVANSKLLKSEGRFIRGDTEKNSVLLAWRRGQNFPDNTSVNIITLASIQNEYQY
jgi:hypothetical protein